MRRAVIDIGTNSVKLLVAENDRQHGVHPLWEESDQTRLGRGFYPEHRLQPDAIARTAEVAARFVRIARQWQAASIRLIGTSAVRDAVNRAELLDAVRRVTGFEVEVISGEQEAEWAFGGVRTDRELQDEVLLIMDVGGGSTEFILGFGQNTRLCRSFPMGTVRLHELIPVSDPPHASDWQKCRATIKTFLDQQVSPVLDPLLKQLGSAPCLIGTGGTPAILASMELQLHAFDRERIEHCLLQRNQVVERTHALWNASLAERQTWPGLPPNRADVILFGAAIFALVMEVLELDQLHVSTRGLRFAAVLDSAG